jgi:hypothetical protein
MCPDVVDHLVGIGLYIDRRYVGIRSRLVNRKAGIGPARRHAWHGFTEQWSAFASPSAIVLSALHPASSAAPSASALRSSAWLQPPH